MEHKREVNSRMAMLRGPANEVRSKRQVILALAAGLPIAFFAPSLADPGGDENAPTSYESLLNERAKALVTIKYVLKIEDEDGAEESEEELTGVMIDPTGIVMCSSASLAAPRLLDTLGIRSSASRIKVIIGEKNEELDAKLVARDQELDLAWLRVKAASGRAFTAIDLTRSVNPRPGDRLLTIARLDKYFERAPVVHEGTLAGILHKPRDLYAIGSSMEGEAGLPVFSATGDLVGVFVMQMPDREDHEGDPEGLFDAMDVFILPAADAASATRRALESEKSSD
ncbi:MAG: hypothetical protein DCC65_18270 [Planctomycetota bacterium]|nr:MAG: hypothetical protein DCC65_18270 [Planctomycetota bacterium]